MSVKYNIILIVLIILIIDVLPIEVDLHNDENFKHNNIDNSQLNECLSVRRGKELGVCFGKELLNKLNVYDEAETFSLTTGVSFVRDDKAPRDIGAFLDKDPMDFRSIIEDASHLISKRSLHWDLSALYPGLVMRIAPTLANGVLEFVMDPRIKDRAYQAQTEMTTGRLLARNLLVPFLLGFKFQLSTLLPLVLGLLLIASKKAFLLAKLALLAITVFSSGFGGQNSLFGGTPSYSSAYTSYEPATHYNDHHPSGYYRRQHTQDHYNYKEKMAETTTAAPISPMELRDRLERIFITKNEAVSDLRDESNIRNGRNFQWTPINTG